MRPRIQCFLQHFTQQKRRVWKSKTVRTLRMSYEEFSFMLYLQCLCEGTCLGGQARDDPDIVENAFVWWAFIHAKFRMQIVFALIQALHQFEEG